MSLLVPDEEVNEGKADSLLLLCACATSAYARVIIETALE